MTQQLTTTFDYSQLDEETRALCSRTAKLADTFMQFTRRTIEKGLELGEHLIKVKESLPHRQYMPYVASIGVPYQVAAYWTRAVKPQRQIDAGEIFDIKYLDEPQSENVDINILPEGDIDRQEVQDILGEHGLPMQDEDDTPLPDGTTIDVAALVAENQQLKAANATLEGQVQEALRQGASVDASAPTRRYGGGSGHHKPPISEKGGVTRTMVNYDHWETTKIRLDPGWNFEDFGMGTIDMQGGTYEIIVSDKKKQCVVPVKPHDIPSVRQELQKLDQGLEKRYAAWKATQK